MDLEGTKRIYKRLKKAIHDKQSLTKFRNCTKCFMPFEWCNKWKEKRKKNEKKLFEQVKNGRCQLEDLILGILAIAMNWGMNKRLQEWTKKEGWEKEGWEEEKMKVKKIKGLTGYLGKKEEWGGLKVFQIIKEVWWILKEKWIKEIKKSAWILII